MNSKQNTQRKKITLPHPGNTILALTRIPSSIYNLILNTVPSREDDKTYSQRRTNPSKSSSEGLLVPLSGAQRAKRDGAIGFLTAEEVTSLCQLFSKDLLTPSPRGFVSGVLANSDVQPITHVNWHAHAWIHTYKHASSKDSVHMFVLGVRNHRFSSFFCCYC